jgi:outer membrane protein TolC
MTMSYRPIGLVIGALLCTVSGGCGTLSPEATSYQEEVARAQADRAKIDQSYVPLTGPLTLSEAIARALKYNYDTQVAKAEVTLQERQLDLAVTQMLPRLALGAGYNNRNNFNASQSINVVTQQPSLVSSYSQEPEYTTSDLTFTWNALDLGVSYFQAKQQGYRVLIAVERRRKVIDSIVRNTANAYWRAASASQLLPRIEPLLAEARRVLTASQRASAEHLQSPLALLDFQQNMVIVLGELERIRNDLASARIELATLINIPNDTKVVFSSSLDALHPETGIDNHKLEEIGLVMRPELHVETYQQKIDRQEIYKEILKMLPGVGMVGGLNYNSDNLLFNNTWGEVGLRATFNLFNLIQGPRAIASAEQAVDLDEQRRLALSVAVLSQINLSVEDYANALDSYKTAEQVDRVGQDISRTANSVTQAGAQSETDRIRRQLTVLTSRIARDRAMVRVQTALASIYSSTGIDLVPAGTELNDLPTLTRQVKTAITDWQAGLLPKQSAAATTASTKPEASHTATSDNTPGATDNVIGPARVAAVTEAK